MELHLITLKQTTEVRCKLPYNLSLWDKLVPKAILEHNRVHNFQLKVNSGQLHRLFNWILVPHKLIFSLLQGASTSLITPLPNHRLLLEVQQPSMPPKPVNSNHLELINLQQPWHNSDLKVQQVKPHFHRLELQLSGQLQLLPWQLNKMLHLSILMGLWASKLLLIIVR